jgi:hypothetical protein
VKSRILAIAAAAALGLAALIVPAAPAFAAGTGTLVVHLVTPAGQAIHTASLAIYTYNADGSAISFAQESESNSLGVITVPEVPAGKVNTEAPQQDGYAFVQKNGLRIASGKTTTINLVLAKGGIIRGRVTIQSTTAGLSDANVEVLNSKGDEVAYAITEGDGSYSVDQLPTGTYRVQFNSKKEPVQGDRAAGLSWSYWNGATKTSTLSWTSANTVSVKAQGSRSAPQTISNINGTVQQGTAVVLRNSLWSPASSHAGQEVQFVGKHNGDSFTATLADDGDLTTYVNPGQYRVAIEGDVDPIDEVAPWYWYVSDTNRPTNVESKATWATIGTETTNLAFVTVPEG